MAKRSGGNSDPDANGYVLSRTKPEFVSLCFGIFLAGTLVPFALGIVALALTGGLGSLGFGVPVPSLSGIGLLSVAVGSVVAVLAGYVLRPRRIPVRSRPGVGGDSGLVGAGWWVAPDGSHGAPGGPSADPGADAGVTS